MNARHSLRLLFPRRLLMATILLGLLATATNSAAQVPNPPTNFSAVPNYGSGTVQIQLAWADNSAIETGYEIQRRVGTAGPWVVIQTTAANVTTYNDAAINTSNEYFYQIRALGAAGNSAFAGPAHQNIKTIWTVRNSHEILHNWNECIGSAGADETGASTGFHMGVDIQRTIASGDTVVATRGGVVVDTRRNGPGTEAVVVVRVLTGSRIDFYQTNHLDTAVVVAMNQNVFAGQVLGTISTRHFTENFVDHTHYVITDSAYATRPQHPLSVFTANTDQDPGNSNPDYTNHKGTPDGTMLFRPDTTDGAGYITDSLLGRIRLAGDVDLIAEVSDQLGTLPDQVPMSLSWWIEEPPDRRDCLMFEGVRTSGSPYMLFNWANAYFGDSSGTFANSITMMRAIVDTVQNEDDSIKVGTETYPWDIYHHFMLTNTKGTNGRPTNIVRNQHWNTNARDDDSTETVSYANYAGRPDATHALEARFPDGDYKVHVTATDLIHTNNLAARTVRLENFPPAVCLCEPSFELAEGTSSYNGRITFTEEMDTSIAASTIVFVDNGASVSDHAWEDSSGLALTFTLNDLVDGETYLITVSDVAKDRAGRKLDGDLDGTAGGAHVCTTMVAADEPTAVTGLFEFSGESRDDGIVIRWGVRLSGDYAGYHIWRTREGLYPVRVTQDPLPDSAPSYPAVFTWIDRDVEDGVSYSYDVEVIYDDGTTEFYGRPVTITAGSQPASFAFAIGSANPVRPAGGTRILYDIPAPGSHVTIALYNVSGRRVRTLVDRFVAPGRHEATVSGNDLEALPSGVYFARMEANPFTMSRRLVLLQ